MGTMVELQIGKKWSFLRWNHSSPSQSSSAARLLQIRRSSPTAARLRCTASSTFFSGEPELIHLHRQTRANPLPPPLCLLQIRRSSPTAARCWGITALEKWRSVTTEDGHVYEANYVILSVSIGVLQSDLISYKPSLPVIVREPTGHNRLLVKSTFMLYVKHVMVSHRSGETEDNFIADLSVGLASGQIKTGAPCRSIISFCASKKNLEQCVMLVKLSDHLKGNRENSASLFEIRSELKLPSQNKLPELRVTLGKLIGDFDKTNRLRGHLKVKFAVLGRY
ncbi:hypothetical protein L1049_021279 [Liquidambar formosana]|uniref:phosphopyruvate hydratase n=1 Tax=Liquidambar formosana TaxID=63359 RepID=A0AAP0X848_LIQFO